MTQGEIKSATTSFSSTKSFLFAHFIVRENRVWSSERRSSLHFYVEVIFGRKCNYGLLYHPSVEDFSWLHRRYLVILCWQY